MVGNRAWGLFQIFDWDCVGRHTWCVLVCFCVAEISGAVITTTAVTHTISLIASLYSSLFL